MWAACVPLPLAETFVTEGDRAIEPASDTAQRLGAPPQAFLDHLPVESRCRSPSRANGDKN